MSCRVCIVGIGVVEPGEQSVRMSHKELLFYATRSALDDAGLERKDIGGAITTSHDFLEGRSLSNQYTLDSIGGVMKPCDLRLAEDGMHGLFAAYMEVVTDPRQIIVAASVQKGSERDPEGLAYQKMILAAMEPIFSRPVCSSVPHLLSLESVLAAMDARAYLKRSGLNEERLARVIVKNTRNAGSDATGGGLDVGSVLESDMVSWPIRSVSRARDSDGACAIILASEKRALSLNQEPVFVRGIGWSSDDGHLARREQGTARETLWAARQAYRMAGIRKPDKEIDFAEVSDWYAHREPMHCEALGLGGPYDMASCQDRGIFERDGALPVNASGGLIGRGNPVSTSGLIRVAQAVRQIRGRAGECQVPGAEVGLAHSWGGFAAPTAGVTVLGRW